MFSLFERREMKNVCDKSSKTSITPNAIENGLIWIIYNIECFFNYESKNFNNTSWKHYKKNYAIVSAETRNFAKFDKILQNRTNFLKVLFLLDLSGSYLVLSYASLAILQDFCIILVRLAYKWETWETLLRIWWQWWLLSVT